MAETDSASYWIVIEGKNFKTGKPIESKRFGPYASELEAERAEPHLLPWDDQDHVYHVHIEADPKTPQSDATKDERSEGWARAAMLKSDPLILSLLRPKNGLDTGGHFPTQTKPFHAFGDCTGMFYAYDVTNTRALPTRLWGMNMGGCVESTPAMWKGVLYFADRQGHLHAVGA